jgi:hypothetical protein
MSKIKTVLLMMFLLGLANSSLAASEIDISGVFGLDPMPTGSAIAVWVPLETDESIGGVMWYNNDGSVSFPEILAVAGSSEYPSVLDEAVVVGEEVSGNTMSWSEYTFSNSFASASSGLFLVFRLPDEGSFIAEGQGAGLGYHLGDGLVRCWVSADEGEWNQLSPDFQMAVAPVMNTNKSGEIVTLGVPGQFDQKENPASSASISGLHIFPNPFNPQTEISFSLPSRRDVNLAIYDIRGRKINTLVDSSLSEGSHTVIWDGRNSQNQGQASGVYFCKLEAGAIQLTGRLMLIK